MVALSDVETAGLHLNPYFAELPEEAQKAIVNQGKIRHVQPGTILFSKGDAADGVYAILTGLLRYSTVSRSGKESILTLPGPGKWIGDISTIDGLGRTQDLVAVEESALLYLATRDYNLLFDHYPAFARMVLKIQGERIRLMLFWIEALMKLNAEGRLAARLLLFAESHGYRAGQGTHIKLRLPQEHLANLIGSTRQRVNQIVNEWEGAGIIESTGHSVTILDENALRALVDLS